MDQKLLVVTVGTVAAGVGQELIKQMNARPANAKRLHTLVRSVDTTQLPNTYGNLINGEWFHMHINPQFMDSIQGDINTHYPELASILYTNMPPETTMAGGGGIRYNGAGAAIINQASLREWLQKSFTDLAAMGEREKNISVALIISSVGATGSGSLERLIETIVSAAQLAAIATPLHCDTFILQPGTTKVTDLGLANSVALFAEMAASQLMKDSDTKRRYQGRTIVMGWGASYSLPALTQVQEATATLVRILNDPISEVAAEYFQRLPDGHVLRDLDSQTGLPSHLSTTTAVTISLSYLEEQFVQRDLARLLDEVVLSTPAEDVEQERENAFQSALANILLGNSSPERFDALLERIIMEGIELESIPLTTKQVQSVGNAQAQSAWLRGRWQADLEKLAQGRAQIQQRGRALAESSTHDMSKARSQAIAAGKSLNEIRADYEEILAIIHGVQQEVTRYEVGDVASRREVEPKLDALAHPGLFGAGRALDSALLAVKNHLRHVGYQAATSTAIGVLKHLERYCTQILSNLKTVIVEAERFNQTNAENNAEFQVEGDHLLSLAALTDQQQVQRYYSKVSIFAPPKENEDSLAFDEGERVDSLARFRGWLKTHHQLDVLFNGDFQLLLTLFKDYTSQTLHERIKDYSVLDVLTEEGQNVLHERILKAITQAKPLIAINQSMAPRLSERRHVIAFYRERQRKVIQAAIDAAPKDVECTLLKSDDPTEIIVLYYADGLPMSAIDDNTGRCLQEFLERRKEYYRFNSNGHSNSHNGTARRAGIPIYSGRDAEKNVRDTGIIHTLYKVRNRGVVKAYEEKDIPELTDPHTH